MSRKLSHIICRMLAITATLIGLTLVSNGAYAGPYDNFQASPGDLIRNDISITWGETGTSPDPISAQDEFEITPINTPGILRAFKHAPNGAPFTINPTEVSEGTPEGPFTSAPAPRDQEGNVISLSAPVPLRETDRILKGHTVFLVLEDAGLNFSSAAIDSLIVTVRDTRTGDTEYLKFNETGQDTGVFVGYFLTREGGNISQDGIVNTTSRSRIDATYTDPWRADRVLNDVVFVGPMDPSGVLFDSRTGLAIDGAKVTLINAETNEPAAVFGDDLSATFPSTITTGSLVVDSSGQEYPLDHGQYRFPFVLPGSYRLDIEPPIGYVAPSLVDDAELQTLSGAPFSLGPGSRLEAFNVLAGANMVVDVPLDGEGFITVTRSGSSDELEIGDFIQYHITVGTNLPADIEGIVHDTIPDGLRILPETALVDDTTPPSDPEVSATGRHVSFSDIVFPKGGVATITYVAQVTPQARSGTILSSTSTANAYRLLANTASHDLSITSTFGRDHDIVLGQVFGNGCQAEHDPDIDLSGIRILLENGRYAETDKDGRFTIREVSRGAHTVALDPMSAPRGFEPVLCNNTTQKSGSPTSRFIEARGGLVRQVFFHLTPVPFRDYPDSIAPILETSAKFDTSWLMENPKANGLIFPAKGYLPPSKSIDIVGARKQNTSLIAYVNGQKVSDLNRRPSITSTEGTTLEVWKGIPLKEGSNVVRLVMTNAEGDIISDETVTAPYNDDVSKMAVVEQASILSSNGRTRPVITFRLTNQNDIPLHPGTIVEITATAPHLFSVDRLKDGVRTEISAPSATGMVDADGLLRLRLAPVQKPGIATFTTSSNIKTIETKAYIDTEGRPFVLVGLAAGTASHQSISENMRAAGDSSLGEIAGMKINGRMSFYAQGVIKGKWLLTARYDSALKDQRGDFFDIDPDEDYIVYGDASTEGNAASSRDALYLKLEGQNGAFLYGDFDTNLNAGVATYARRLTGSRLLFGDDAASVIAFLTDTSQRFVEDSFPADGTSGPFILTEDDILTFSERVYIETTNRHDASEVLERTELERGRDYDINYSSRRLFLSDPLPSRDADFNPNAIVVQYEMDSEDSDGIITGARASTEISESLMIGVTAVHEDNVGGSDGHGQILGVDAQWKIDDRLTASLGLGYSHQGSSDTLPDGAYGRAAEARLRYSDDRKDIEAYLRSQDTAFDIQNQKQDGDQIISAGVDVSVLLHEEEVSDAQGGMTTLSHTLEATAQAEKNIDDDQELFRTETAYRRSKGELSRSIGLRSEHLVSSGEKGSGLKLFGSTETQTKDGRLRLSFGQELTLVETGDLTQPDRGILTTEYDATNALTFKAGHEIAFDDDLRVNILSFGASVDVWEGGELNIGTTSASGQNGTHTVGHTGFWQEFGYTENTTFRFGLERQSPIAGDFEALGPINEAGLSNPRLSESFWAINAGFDHSGDIWETGASAEYKSADSGSQHRLKLRAVRPLSEDLSFSTRAEMFQEHGADGDWSKDYDIGSSLAWRPLDSRFALLDQIRLRHESDNDDLGQTRLINSLFYTKQLDQGHEINLRHGIKLAQFDFSGEKHKDVLNLIGAEYRHQLNEWSDIGIHGTSLHSFNGSNTEFSTGMSFGFTPFENGWLSFGYNWSGFSDDDFAEGGETAKGAFMQFRLKLDGTSLEKLQRRSSD